MSPALHNSPSSVCGPLVKKKKNTFFLKNDLILQLQTQLSHGAIYSPKPETFLHLHANTVCLVKYGMLTLGEFQLNETKKMLNDSRY